MGSVAVTGGPTNPEVGMTLADLRAFVDQCDFVGAEDNLPVSVVLKDGLLMTTSVVVEHFKMPNKKHTGVCRCTGGARTASDGADKQQPKPRTASGINFDGRSDR